MKIFITTDAKQTKGLGKLLAEEIKGGPASRRPVSNRQEVSSRRGGKIICLEGELGSGKTTFTQGLLKGLGIKGPYTSPTFVVMKRYKRKLKGRKLLTKIQSSVQIIYHIDAYRVTAKNVLDIGWEEIISDKSGIIIVEWADKIRKIIPKNSIWIKFKWLDENKRKIILLSA